MKNLNTRGFETSYGVNIHFRIQSGRTQVFESKQEAEKEADRRRSYSYPVFDCGYTTKYFAVPN